MKNLVSWRSVTSPLIVDGLDFCFLEDIIFYPFPAHLFPSSVTQVLDTAGQEEYTALRDQWIRDGEGFVLVYSIIAKSTFERVHRVFLFPFSFLPFRGRAPSTHSLTRSPLCSSA